tara:strand:- start:3066 stop:3179 length:114 start_codon:yes stop_codon:yes gene_type:complete
MVNIVLGIVPKNKIIKIMLDLYIILFVYLGITKKEII